MMPFGGWLWVELLCLALFCPCVGLSAAQGPAWPGSPGEKPADFALPSVIMVEPASIWGAVSTLHGLPVTPKPCHGATLPKEQGQKACIGALRARGPPLIEAHQDSIFKPVVSLRVRHRLIYKYI